MAQWPALPRAHRLQSFGSVDFFIFIATTCGSSKAPCVLSWLSLARWVPPSDCHRPNPTSPCGVLRVQVEATSYSCSPACGHFLGSWWGACPWSWTWARGPPTPAEHSLWPLCTCSGDPRPLTQELRGPSFGHMTGQRKQSRTHSFSSPRSGPPRCWSAGSILGPQISSLAPASHRFKR